MHSKASRRKDLFFDDRRSVLAPDPGFNYYIPRTLSINLNRLTFRVNKSLGTDNVTPGELVSAFLFDGLLPFHYDILDGSPDGGAVIIDADGAKVDEVEITVAFPKFLGKRLVQLATYRSLPRIPNREHLFIKYIILDNMRHGTIHCVRVLRDYRSFCKYQRAQEEIEDKER
jgi:hypothetical protein